MNVLVVGQGGREAALALKIAASPIVNQVVITPWHPACAHLSPKISTSALPAEMLAREGAFQLAVIGPEDALADGLADRLRSLGVPTVGPGAEAARLETSKIFAKQVMASAGVPTAQARWFSDPTSALNYVHGPCVVKADGPVQGKGVFVCDDIIEARRAVGGLFHGDLLGRRVSRILVEERMSGAEVSAFFLCHGQQFVWLGEARDHKRLRDGDLGPNTGGMGAFSPVADFSTEDRVFCETQVVAPLLAEMSRRGCPYQGFLFVGLMRTDSGLKVIEFNARMGDPETQVLTHRWEGDIMPMLLAAAHGATLVAPKLSSETCVHVVLAAEGYPGVAGDKVRTGTPIAWLPFPRAGVVVYPSGLTERDGRWVNRGGRVVGITAPTLKEALAVATETAFTGAQWRTDIGSRA